MSCIKIPGDAGTCAWPLTLLVGPAPIDEILARGIAVGQNLETQFREFFIRKRCNGEVIFVGSVALKRVAEH